MQSLIGTWAAVTSARAGFDQRRQGGRLSVKDSLDQRAIIVPSNIPLWHGQPGPSVLS
jgi:hypothetical protein